MYQQWRTLAMLALGVSVLSCTIGPSGEVPTTTVRIDNLTLDEIDKKLEEMGVPKQERNKIIQEEKESRDKKSATPSGPTQTP